MIKPKQQTENLYQMVRTVLAKFCDECGTSYQDDDLRIVQKDENSILVHLSCKNCGKTHLATIMKPLGITNRIPLKTDLQPTEIMKFAGKKPVSSDDLLDAYEWCKKVADDDNANLNELFK